jgi:predicted lipoprotein with Yx(FWY)xxD motif
MEFIPLRGRIFLLVIIFAVIIFIIINSCRTNGNSAVNPPENVGTASPIPTPTPIPRNMVVRMSNTSVYGDQETILTDRDGRTLYYSKNDAWHKMSCTGDCTEAWIPLLFKGKGPVIASAKLPGKLLTDKTVNGNQVAYNGHYLYTFAGDSTPGDIQGQGRNDEWYVATPNLQ